MVSSVQLLLLLETPPSILRQSHGTYIADRSNGGRGSRFNGRFRQHVGCWILVLFDGVVDMVFVWNVRHDVCCFFFFFPGFRIWIFLDRIFEQSEKNDIRIEIG